MIAWSERTSLLYKTWIDANDEYVLLVPLQTMTYLENLSERRHGLGVFVTPNLDGVDQGNFSSWLLTERLEHRSDRSDLLDDGRLDLIGSTVHVGARKQSVPN